MMTYHDIKHVHLELSTYCNAACPGCGRNINGASGRTDYPLHSLTISEIKKIFHREFLLQLGEIFINGNLGDFVANKDNLEIVRYFKSVNPDITIGISTNASVKSKIWKDLAMDGVTVMFCIDGLADTHSLYRQQTDWDLILKNAADFISVGKGKAVWKMIKFAHNLHQIDECRDLSKKIGFSNFLLVDGGRDTFQVFNRSGIHTHNIGNVEKILSFEDIKKNILKKVFQPTAITPSCIDCLSVRKKSIYIAGNGQVFPCCFTGFFPGQMSHPFNADVSALITTENNALVVGIENSIEWFNNFIPHWENKSLYVCNKMCGISPENPFPRQ
jgi:MoaA/NifB/PqqE/SkfB family radical SAM enzyme